MVAKYSPSDYLFVIFSNHTSRIVDFAYEQLTFSNANRYEAWQNAMKAKIQALHSNNTWSLVPFHHSINVIGCCRVYKIKRRVDGSIKCYKVHLVAKCFSQHEDIDYFEIFNHVLKQATVWLIFTVAVSRGWKINQLDIHNAFLNETLDKEVYIQQPSGFVDSTLSSHVY